MDEEDKDCDSGVLLIDVDDEVIEVKEGIDEETPVTHRTETNENKAYDNKSVEEPGKYPKVKTRVIAATNGNTNKQSKKKYTGVKVIEEATNNNFISFLRHRLTAKEDTNYSTNVNELQHRRGLADWTRRQVNMNGDMYEVGDRGERVTDRTVYKPDVYEAGYALEECLPYDLITRRPSRTDIYNPGVPNVAYRLQAANAFRPEVNAHMADVYDDYRHTIIDRNVYKHAHRQDSLGDDHDPRINRAYILAHELEGNLNMDYRPIMNRNPYDLRSYRHKQHRHALNYDFLYDTNSALHFDRYRSREELANVYRPLLVGMDPYRLDRAFHEKVYYPETAVNMYAYPQAAHIDHYRHNLSRNVSKQEEMAHNHEEEAINAQTRFEADVTRNPNRVRRPIPNPRNEINVPLAINKNKSEVQDKPVMPVHRNETTPSHRTTAVIGNNVQLSSIKKLEAADVEHMKPGVPVRTNRPDTVILSTKSIYRTATSSKETPNLPKQTILVNTSNDHDQNVNKTVKHVNNNETELGNKTQTGDTKQINYEKETMAASGQLCTNIATTQEINKVVQENNTRYLVVFFKRVKVLVKDVLPEFSKALQKEIEKLEKTGDNKLKTCIQYICPRYCSMSTYSFPRFDNTEDDNKVEPLDRAHVCDLCTCIQSCYRMYKNKYFNLLSMYIDEGKKGRKGKEENTKNIYRTRKNADTDETIPSFNVNGEINKKSRNDAIIYEYDRNTQIHNVAHINSNVPITNQNLEYTLFNALSNLTFNLPKDSIEDTHNLRKEKPLQEMYDLANASILSNNCISAVNKTAPIKPVVTIAFNIEPETANDTNYNIDKDNSKDEPITSLASNECHADISSKLSNKMGRKPNAVFTCHVCSCMYTNFMSFVNHMQKEHNINGLEEDIPDECLARKCPLCGVYSKQKYHNLHVKKYHPDIFTYKGEPVKIKMKKEYNEIKADKFRKKKFVFTCLICNEELKSREVNGHREKKHKGVNVEKMFSKKLR